MASEWESDGWFSDILGNGSAWGDMRGKVKTKQIGFIRDEVAKKVPRKTPVKGRAGASQSKRNK